MAIKIVFDAILVHDVLLRFMSFGSHEVCSISSGESGWNVMCTHTCLTMHPVAAEYHSGKN